MIRLQLIVMFSLVSVIIAYQSPSTTPTINGPPDDLLEDLRKIAEKITGDPDNLDKLTQQLKEISVNNQNLAKLIESQMGKFFKKKSNKTLIQLILLIFSQLHRNQSPLILVN